MCAARQQGRGAASMEPAGTYKTGLFFYSCPSLSGWLPNTSCKLPYSLYSSMCMCAHVCVGHQYWVGIFLNHSQPCFFVFETVSLCIPGWQLPMYTRLPLNLRDPFASASGLMKSLSQLNHLHSPLWFGTKCSPKVPIFRTKWTMGALTSSVVHPLIGSQLNEP